MFQVKNIDGDIKQNFEYEAEAMEYVLKLGDQNILATINFIEFPKN